VGFFFGFKTKDPFWEREGRPKAPKLFLDLLEFLGMTENNVTPANDFGTRITSFDQFIHWGSLR
jgi:hypothetical protein